MASATMATCWFRPPVSFPSLQGSNGVRFSSVLKLSSRENMLVSRSFCPEHLTPIPDHRQQPSSLTIVAAKGYKMKTHKASAKRFRVTGNGKIVRRRAGKQHLLGKKNTKRKLRLSKMIPVNKSDYNNVIGALPYLKVNRQAN